MKTKTIIYGTLNNVEIDMELYYISFYRRSPSRNSTRHRLGLAYYQYRQQLRTTLAHIDAIAITIDVWTKNRISFVCSTGHVFNRAYQSIPIVLGFRRFAKSHE